MKVNFGIHISDTSASIARMIDGQPTIIDDRSTYNMPVCVAFNRRGDIRVGVTALNCSESFSGFLRTIGTDKTYYSSNTNQEYSSEQLLGIVIRTLRSFVKDVHVKASVITVPAMFDFAQVEAIRKAGMLGGLEQVEILIEPVAAVFAYNFRHKIKDGKIVVFDFGVGSFDAALVKAEEGIINVIDTEGDYYLGGKNLDFAIVDEIILPYIQEKFVIDSILADDTKKQILRNAMKFYAEETKGKLSFNDTHNILSNLGEFGEDDEGEEFELDITVTQEEITKVLSPVFQKAVNVCLNLLVRNNLKGSSLLSLILVGGNTYSPVLRQMLEEQVCKPDTSLDPTTVISKGAALYASTVELSDEIKEQTRDKTKIQLEIGHEAVTLETEEFVTLKILDDKTEREIPEKVFAIISRGDNSWTSGKFEVGSVGEVLEIQLIGHGTNNFEIVLFDGIGNQMQCEPSAFSIIQSGGFLQIPYNIGIEQKDKQTGKIIFRTIKGLEKNQMLPAVGTINGIKTVKEIRPGVESDYIKIPIYQGEHNAEGTRAIYNEHVADIQINGADLPCLLPKHSDIDLTIKVDVSQRISVLAYFPTIDFSTEIELNAISNKLSLVEVEDLLFELFENEKIESSVFQKHFDIIFEMKKENNPDLDILNKIYKELKTLPNNV